MRPADRLAIVIPAKRLAEAKSRLDLPDPVRREVAQHLLSNTVATAMGCRDVSSVTVVTSDPVLAAITIALGADVVPEPERAGLCATLDRGREHALRSRVDAIGLLMADLPAITAEDLTAVHREFRDTGGPAMVRDLVGTGTTTVIHPSDQQPSLLFGPDSAARHAAVGYRLIAEGLTRLRHDLDTVADITDEVSELVFGAIVRDATAGDPCPIGPTPIPETTGPEHRPMRRLLCTTGALARPA